MASGVLRYACWFRTPVNRSREVLRLFVSSFRPNQSWVIDAMQRGGGCFTSTTTRELVTFASRRSVIALRPILRKRCREAESQGCKAIVLDLRNNAGGALGAAVALCEMLLPAGTMIVETRGRDDVLYQQYETTKDGSYRNLPIAVLVNQTTASAAEIVAACLQDHGRAIIVGQRTFGKGTVQQLLPLESGKSLLKLTWAGFRRPGGANIHRSMDMPESETWGVMPDAGFERTLTAEQFAAWQDFRDERDDSDLLSDDSTDVDASKQDSDPQTPTGDAVFAGPFG